MDARGFLADWLGPAVDVIADAIWDSVVVAVAVTYLRGRVRPPAGRAPVPAARRPRWEEGRPGGGRGRLAAPHAPHLHPPRRRLQQHVPVAGVPEPGTPADFQPPRPARHRRVVGAGQQLDGVPLGCRQLGAEVTGGALQGGRDQGRRTILAGSSPVRERHHAPGRGEAGGGPGESAAGKGAP
jgi:hypothetical protein